MNEAKAAFMRIETPEEFMAFKQKYPNAKADKEMALHLNKVAREHSAGESLDFPTDPRAAFLKK